jgi:hypothetical protein
MSEGAVTSKTGTVSAAQEANTHASVVQALSELVDAVHDGEPASIARAMRGALAVLRDGGVPQ